MEQIVTFGSKLDGIQYRVRQGVYAVIIDHESQSTAAVKTSTGFFLPGGGIQADESHEECLKRESIEELGYEIEIGTFIGRAQKYFYSTTLNAYMLSDGYFYLAAIGRHVHAPTEEDHELVWIKRDRVKELLFLEHQAWAVIEAFNRG